MQDRWLYAWGLGSVALGAASLLVPLYVVALGGDAVALGTLAASAALLGTPGALVWGRLADRTTDRRAVVVASLVGVAMTLAIVPLLESVTAVLVANAVLWVVAAAAGPVVTLLAVAGAPESEWPRRIGLSSKFQGYGWAAGLLLGMVWLAVVTPLSSSVAAQRTLFAVCAACAVVSALTAASWLPDAGDRAPTDERDRRRIARALDQANRHVRAGAFPFTPSRLYWSTRAIHPRRLARRFTPKLAAYFVAVALFSVGFAAFWAPLPLYLSDAGYGADVTFALYLASSLGSAACYGIAGAASTRRDVRLLQSGALGVRAGAFPVVALVVGVGGASALALVPAIAVFAIIGVTWAFIAVTATAIVTRLAPPSLRGEALGVYTALTTAAGGVGGLLGGWLVRFGYVYAFGGASAVVIAGATLVVALRGLSSSPGRNDASPDSSMD